MSEELAVFLIYGTPMLVIFLFYIRGFRKKHKKNLGIKVEAIRDGLTEPASLHPIVNPIRCIGCGSCVAACPEKEVLGLVHNKAELISPTQCIGHGACKVVCPTGAIKLVFGTERRGLDLPEVAPNFETNVPGVFVAGELGGMGLIRNAIEQGRQAMDSVRERLKKSRPTGSDVLDVLIIGAGPAGFSATLSAMENKMRYVTVEQDSLGGTVSHYPRGKLVMTAPAILPLVGKVKFTETSKEELMDFWTGVAKKFNVRINYKERVESIDQTSGYFNIKTTKKTYKSRSVLLAIGRRGTPRKLGVTGEDKSKVVYRLIDPEQYRNKHVLVVGGGDSALEAAWSIAELGSPVTLSYRSEAFSRAKKKNRLKVEEMEQTGTLKTLMKSNVKSINDDSVDITLANGSVKRIKNDGVIVCAGGILPTGFLKDIGIQVITKYGTE
ncbi:MAG: NAD(P)-binding domain-containing protein [Pseudomonadota bacterium]